MHVGTIALTLYRSAKGQGYIIVSSQGNSTYVLYDRSEPNTYVGTFEIVANDTIDKTSNTDGICVVSSSLGQHYPKGLFITHDDGRDRHRPSSFKLVPWEKIAQAFTPSLLIDSTFNPRE